MDHAQDNIQDLVRASLYIGVFLILGAGVFARYVGREIARGQAWRLWYMLSLGFMAALASSLYGAYHTVWMLGDTSLLGSYFLETTQGNLLLVRMAILLVLLGLSLGWARIDRWLYPPLAVGLLLTLTLTAHAGAKGGLMIAADLIHLSFGSAWAGSLLALALCWPGSRYAAVLAAVERLSRLGLVGVGIISLSGAYLATIQVGLFSNLLESAYGRTLLLKLGLVAGVLAVAGINRMWLLPRLRSKGVRGLPSVSLEALLVAVVLGVSGVLASSEPPTAQAALPTTVDIEETAGAYHYSGQLYAQVGEVRFVLDIKDLGGKILEQGPSFRVRFASQGNALEQVVRPFQKAQYHSTFQVPPGTWEVTIGLPDDTLQYTLTVPGP